MKDILTLAHVVFYDFLLQKNEEEKMKTLPISLILALFLVFPTALLTQGTMEDYQRAEIFLPWNAEKLIFPLCGEPNWIGKGDTFWYLRRAREGKTFVLVDPAKRTSKPAFDHAKLAQALPLLEGKAYEAHDLPFDKFEFVRDGKAIRFPFHGENWFFDLDSYACGKSEISVPAAHEVLSPDAEWIAYVEKCDVYVRSARTGEVIQLSKDGEENYDYGREDYEPDFLLTENARPRKPTISAIWSPDSKKLFTYRTDQRKARKTYLLQSAVPGGGMRTLFYSYPYPLPGESDIPLAEPVVFDIEKRRQVSIKWQALLEPLISWRHPRGFWSADGSKIYFIDMMRGYKTAFLVEADAQSGNARKILEEQSPTLVDHNVQLLHIVNNGDEIIWSSERSGWNHLYLYNGKTGELKNEITRGEWPVRSIERVDEKNRVVYFTAGSLEKDRDPYLRHLYRIRMDGSGLKLLTPEDADHSVRISPAGKHFVDLYSRVDTIPLSVVRQISDGRVLMELDKPDLKLLLSTGWKGIEPFRAKARDGQTDIYGVIFRPTKFDASKKYPVIENIYSGPHTFNAPKQFPLSGWNFRNAFISQSVAELGFIVVIIDGLGQNFRSKAFRDHQYRNLVDCGLKDRIEAIRQLAERYPYMDTNRVGIFGFSAGGYAAARAVLDYPEFYKVAVASAGNHDHRMDKLSWNERWMGHPVEEHYNRQSNITDAHKLKAKLLLTYGDLDTNVPPASTIKMVYALIEANKDFDMLIFPNRGHYLDEDPYFTRRRWDYFVENLLGVEPPKDYTIKKPKEGRD